MKTRTFVPLIVVAGILAACSTMPTGPSVLALPGTGRSLDDFRASDARCQADAWQQIGGMTQAADPGVRNAVIGTAIGAAAGAAMGGQQGAGIGAGAGLLLGSATGAEASSRYGYDAQRRYDNAYIQCMYTKGHRVPVPGNISYTKPVKAADAGFPPPPPGMPPPPPPSVKPSPVK